MQSLADVRINWRLKAVLPVMAVLLAGLLAFTGLVFSSFVIERHHIIILAAGGAVLICAVILAGLAVLIQRPLIELRQKIAAVRKGDLSVTASFAARNDELGDLGRDFNEMVGTLRDSIAELERAEGELRYSESTLKRAQEIAHIGSWYLDLVHDRLTWSDEVFRIFGIVKGTALTYEKFLGMIYPDDRESVNKAWAATLHGAPYDIEHRILVAEEVKWVRERAKVEFDDTGRAIGGIGTVQDITERKRAQAQLSRIYKAQRALSKCNQALIRASDECTLLQQICGIVVEEAGYRLCWAGRAERDEAQSVRPLAHAGFESGYLETLQITWADTERGRGPAGTCIRARQTVIVKNIATDPRMAPWRAQALERGYASSIAIPLIVDSDVFGALMIYSSEPEAFGPEEVDLLTELAGDLAFGIETLRTRIERNRAEEELRALNIDLERRVTSRTAELEAANQLKDELIVRERQASAEVERARERQAEIGFRIQQTLLLDEPPQEIPGLRLAAFMVPSERIGGDFYMFQQHQNQCLDVIVGDVMGKGIPAALLGAATKSHFIKALSDLMTVSKNNHLPAPQDVVMLAHAGIVRHLIELESFVTLCYARLDINKHTLELVDCGHTGIVQWHGDTGVCEVRHGDNVPMGIREGEIYDQISIPLRQGDLLLLYSDGITDARNAAKELFGIERLKECVLQYARLEPGAVLEGIRKEIFAFRQSERLGDDLTGVAIRVEEAQLPVAAADLDIQSDLKQLRRVREFVDRFCQNLPGPPLDEDSTGALELAVNEATSNIIKHAYHGRADQSIHLEMEAFPGRISVRLHHLGDPFEPSKVPPPRLDGSRDSGFGTYIISQTIDEVRYYRDERGRNCVALMKVRK